MKPHNPRHLPTEGLGLDHNIFAAEEAQAQYALGVLEGSQRKLQNPSLLISPLTAKEATVSSRIEGTQSTVSDVFMLEAGGEPKYFDTRQVLNYRKAMTYVIGQLKQGRLLSIHLIRTAHAMLLDGVRHKGTPGEFRKGLVWIAEKDGDPIEKALYVPPESYFVPDYMENLLTYIDRGRENDLIKAGVAHYQFEAVHPFEDGNGRIGRLLIPLILFHKRKISSPILYISGYLDAHRDEYIKALHRVDESGEFEKWLTFFCRGVATQLEETQKIIESVYSLHDDVIREFGSVKSPYLRPLIEYMFQSPVFTIPAAQKTLGANTLTVRRLVRTFEKRKAVRELPVRRRRAKLFRFNQLLDILH